MEVKIIATLLPSLILIAVGGIKSLHRKRTKEFKNEEI
jgi:hypothetical protein